MLSEILPGDNHSLVIKSAMECERCPYGFLFSFFSQVQEGISIEILRELVQNFLSLGIVKKSDPNFRRKAKGHVLSMSD